MEKHGVQLIYPQTEEITRHQKTKADLKKKEAEFRQKNDELWKLYVRDMAIKDILANPKMGSEQKIEKIKKMMDELPTTPDKSRIAADEEMTMLYVENSALVEKSALLEQELEEQKEKYEAEIDEWKRKLELEHRRAVMLAMETPLVPPSPPRRRLGTTNPFM